MVYRLWPNPPQTLASRLVDLTVRQALGIKCNSVKSGMNIKVCFLNQKQTDILLPGKRT